MAIARRPRRKRLKFDPSQFRNLTSTNHTVTSDPVEEQNCIGFAAGDSHFWWPATEFPHGFPPPYFWPKDCALEATVDAFICAFKLVGFERCDDDDEHGHLEAGIEKLAIFAKRSGNPPKVEPTHAAIQSPTRNGKWRSKMGSDEDIEHDLSSVRGRLYGEVVCFMKRTFAEKEAAKAKLKKREIASH